MVHFQSFTFKELYFFAPFDVTDGYSVEFPKVQMKCWEEKHRGTEDTEKAAVVSSVISVPPCFTNSS